MFLFITQRILQAIVVMLVVSLFVFIGVYAIGNPVDVMIGPDATQQMRDELVARFGFDRPLYEQYFSFLWRLLHGDLGTSLVFNTPVLQLMSSRLPATLELALAAVIGATVVGVPLGIYAGYRPQSLFSRLIMALSIVGFSVPTFWIGLVLIFTFAVTLGWLPAGGRGQTVDIFGSQWSFLTLNGLTHLLLPALNLSLFKLALMIRLARAGTREAMLSDTIKYARGLGQSEWTVLRHHVLWLISIPIVTVFGLELGTTLAFAVVTETIFSWPGLGKLIIDSIFMLDRPVMIAYLVVVAFVFVTINLVIDLVYLALDPRLRKASA